MFKLGVAFNLWAVKCLPMVALSISDRYGKVGTRIKVSQDQIGECIQVALELFCGLDLIKICSGSLASI